MEFVEIVKFIFNLWWLWLTTATISGAYLVHYQYKKFNQARDIIRNGLNRIDIGEVKEKAWEGLRSAVVMTIVLKVSIFLLAICFLIAVLRIT